MKETYSWNELRFLLLLTEHFCRTLLEQFVYQFRNSVSTVKGHFLLWGTIKWNKEFFVWTRIYGFMNPSEELCRIIPGTHLQIYARDGPDLSQSPVWFNYSFQDYRPQQHEGLRYHGLTSFILSKRINLSMKATNEGSAWAVSEQSLKGFPLKRDPLAPASREVTEECVGLSGRCDAWLPMVSKAQTGCNILHPLSLTSCWSLTPLPKQIAGLQRPRLSAGRCLAWPRHSPPPPFPGPPTHTGGPGCSVICPHQ